MYVDPRGCEIEEGENPYDVVLHLLDLPTLTLVVI